MRFEWDDKKSASNLRKHGIGFDTAELVFDDPWQVPILDHDVDGEERWQTIGRAEDVLLLLVVHTVEDDEDEVIRIISPRRATPHERRIYESGFY